MVSICVCGFNSTVNTVSKVRTFEVGSKEVSLRNREISIPDFGLNLRRKF